MQQKEEGKSKSSSPPLNVREHRVIYTCFFSFRILISPYCDPQAWDETGEYFLLLLLAIVILYLVNDLLNKFFLSPSSSSSPCNVDSSTEEEPLVPALCQLDGYANQNCFERL